MNQYFISPYDKTPEDRNNNVFFNDRTSKLPIQMKTKNPKLLNRFDILSNESLTETLSSNTDIPNISYDEKDKKTGKMKKQKSSKPFEVNVVKNKSISSKTSNPGIEKDKNLPVNEKNGILRW